MKKNVAHIILSNTFSSHVTADKGRVVTHHVDSTRQLRIGGPGVVLQSAAQCTPIMIERLNLS